MMRLLHSDTCDAGCRAFRFCCYFAVHVIDTLPLSLFAYCFGIARHQGLENVSNLVPCHLQPICLRFTLGKLCIILAAYVRGSNVLIHRVAAGDRTARRAYEMRGVDGRLHSCDQNNYMIFVLTYVIRWRLLPYTSRHLACEISH